MAQHEIDQDKCLKCGKHLTGAANIDGDNSPQAGDFTVCLYCGHVMEFNSDLKLVELSDSSLIELAGDFRLVSATRISSIFRERFGKDPK